MHNTKEISFMNYRFIYNRSFIEKLSDNQSIYL